MCPRSDCVYCEIVELPSGSKLFIHYNSLFTPLWIEFDSEATDINEKYFPENRDLRETHLKAERHTPHLAKEDDWFIDGGYGIKLSKNWEDMFRQKRFQMDCKGNIIDTEPIDLEIEEIK